MTDIKLPPISKDLIDTLETLFPDKCPDINDSDRKIWIDAGQQKIIKFMKHQFKLQQEAAKDLTGSGDLPLTSIFNKPQ
jgi:hypothetical protein